MRAKKQKKSNYLNLRTSKGFAYNVPNSIILTTYPSIGIIFFLQSSVRFYDGSNFKEIFKTQNPISTLSLRGKMLAIGEKMMKGQLTTTTVYNLETRKAKTFRYQKTAIQHLSLSVNSEYLCTVGSSDTLKQELLIIDLIQQLQFGFKTITELQFIKKNGRIISISFSNKDPNILSILFTNNLTILKIDGKKANQRVAKSSKVREFSMGVFDPEDIFCFLASKNGDISQINVKELKQTRIGPRKRVIISGIKHIRFVKPNRLVITGVKGFIALVDLTDLKILKQVSLKEEIISLTQFEGDLGFISTDKATIYILDASTLDIRQFYTCHSSRVNQICFIDQFCEVFATCADRQIILWRNYNLAPILKISLPNSFCLSLNLLRDGSRVVSGWSDDCIRFFNPKNGKKMQQIPNAHNGKVTALASTMNSNVLFSGGDDGRIRSWKLDKQRFGIIDNIFTGHKSEVHYLKLYGEELYSCSQDGSFAIWNSINGQKKAFVRISNFLRKVIPIDDYTIYAIGSGPQLLKVAKNDGKVYDSVYIGGSHLNDFDIIKVEVSDKNLKLQKQLIAFGGQIHSVFLHQFGELSGLSNHQQGGKQQHYAYGEVTCVKFAPDTSTMIAGTNDGSLLCFDLTTKLV